MVLSDKTIQLSRLGSISSQREYNFLVRPESLPAGGWRYGQCRVVTRGDTLVQLS